MKGKFQSPRGTHDLLPDDCRRHGHIRAVFERYAEGLNAQPIATPIFEPLGVFEKSLGDTSDVVGKEMYRFADRGGEEMVLRPEGTAAVVRAAINHGLLAQLPQRLYYSGPMFRYERPQKGRQRQFHQVGLECLGSHNPLSDVEVIAAAWGFLQALNLTGPLTLEINSLGDAASRAAYRTALVAFLEARRDQLSPESQERLEKNPLRVLDSKDEGDKAALNGAPQLKDFFTADAAGFYEKVCAGLRQLEIPFTENPRLVRGLDYYRHTAFEVTTPALGAQATVLAGGRYDDLVEQMGGQPCAGVGWAAGMERLALLLPDLPAGGPLWAVLPVEADDEQAAFVLAHQLCQHGAAVDGSFAAAGLGKALTRAAKRGVRYAVILGAGERAAGEVTVKDLQTGAQKRLAAVAAGLLHDHKP